MGRRKSVVPPSLQNAEKKKEKSRFPFRRGDSSRSFQEVESPPTTGQDLTPITSRNESTFTNQRRSSIGRLRRVEQPEVDPIREIPTVNGTADTSHAPSVSQVSSTQPAAMDDAVQPQNLVSETPQKCHSSKLY